MAAFDFPSSPVNGQTYTANGVTYKYSSALGVWQRQIDLSPLTLSGQTVGINQTSPTANLHVIGNAIVSTDLSVGTNVTAQRLISNIATGTAPLVVTSTTRVANLNVDTAGTAQTVTTAAQPNITSVGTLTSLSTSGDVTVGGNLTVNGQTTTINSTVATIDDLNLTLASGAASAAQANGAGLTIDGANATLTYLSVPDLWSFDRGLIVNGRILQTSTSTPATPGADSMAIYVTASGTSPNREVAYKIMNEFGEEIIISSTLT